MSFGDYLELLDASARMIRTDQAGSTSAEVAPIFERLNLDVGYWKLQVYPKCYSQNPIPRLDTRAVYLCRWRQPNGTHFVSGKALAAGVTRQFH